MNKRAKLTYLCAVIFLFGVTACSTNSHQTEESITGTTGVTPEVSSSNNEPSSAGFTMTASSSNGDTNLEEEDSSSNNEELTFDVYMSNQFDITSQLTVTTGSEEPSSDQMKVNPIYAAYQDVPQNMSYNGYSSISYTINGSSYSTSLNTEERDIFDELEYELNEAESYGGGGPTPTPTLTSANVNNGQLLDKPIEAMTDQEVKKFLKDQGYKVKKLGNRRFEITKKYNENDPGRSMSIVSIFDATTLKMEPGYTIYKGGKEHSKNISKYDKKNKKRLGKSEIKRAEGEYLLFGITHKKIKN